MAELNRQLKDYLSQSRGAPPAAPPAPPTAVSMPEEDSGGSWPLRWLPAGDAASAQCLPALTYTQRLLGCGACALLAALCFGAAALRAPTLLLSGRRFGLLWSLGSLLALLSAALVRSGGPLTASASSAVYLCALAGTLYAALALHSTLLTLTGACLQLAAMAAHLIGLLPGGARGARYVSGLALALLKRTVSRRNAFV